MPARLAVLHSKQPKPDGTPVLRSALLEELPWLVHGFSTRNDGQSGSGFDLARDGGAAGEARRRRWRDAVCGGARKSSAWPLMEMHQVHSAVVWKYPNAWGGGAAGDGPAGDAWISRAGGRLFTIRTADCLPLLLADRRLRVVAAVHAGWRGTAARIAQKTVGEMRRQFGSRPEDLLAALGPAIGVCCYHVGEEVRQAFEAGFADTTTFFRDAGDDDLEHRRYPAVFMTGAPPGHPHDPRWNPERTLRLDLAAANVYQLTAAGMSAVRIEVLPYCTRCRADLFFSYRRDQGGTAAACRMAASIGCKPVRR